MTARSPGTRRVRRRKFVSKLLPQSQLIIVVLQLGRLDQAADLGPTIQVRRLLCRIFRLLFDLIKLGVVTRELLQRNEEVTQVQTKLIVLRVEREETLNESSDLWSITLVSTHFELTMKEETYA